MSFVDRAEFEHTESLGKHVIHLRWNFVKYNIYVDTINHQFFQFPFPPPYRTLRVWRCRSLCRSHLSSAWKPTSMRNISAVPWRPYWLMQKRILNCMGLLSQTRLGCLGLFCSCALWNIHFYLFRVTFFVSVVVEPLPILSYTPACNYNPVLSQDSVLTASFKLIKIWLRYE